MQRDNSGTESVPNRHVAWRETLKNPLDSLWGTIICGVLITIVLYFVASAIYSHAAQVTG